VSKTKFVVQIETEISKKCYFVKNSCFSAFFFGGGGVKVLKKEIKTKKSPRQAFKYPF